MAGSRMTRCPRCGGALLPQMDPSAPADAGAAALLADPPFRLVCLSPECAAQSGDDR